MKRLDVNPGFRSLSVYNLDVFLVKEYKIYIQKLMTDNF